MAVWVPIAHFFKVSEMNQMGNNLQSFRPEKNNFDHDLFFSFSLLESKKFKEIASQFVDS